MRSAGGGQRKQHEPAMRLLLGLAAFGATLTKNVDAVCPKASAPVNKNRAGCDQKQLATATYQACQTACCADSLCVSWNWDSNLTTGRPPPCKTGGCCWLKACDKGPGAPAPACPAPGCTSFSGTSGRPEPPAPPPPPLPPPPAPVCPSGPGKPCFFNHGTRPGVTASYDCEMRKHVGPLFTRSSAVAAPPPPPHPLTHSQTDSVCPRTPGVRLFSDDPPLTWQLQVCV